MSTILPATTATGVSLHPDSAGPRQRRRLSEPPTPSKLSTFAFRLHHGETSPTVTTANALDLSSAPPIQTLASLRWLLLTYLGTLEQSLLRMAGVGGNTSSAAPSDAGQWAKTALDMLDNIRSEIVSHFPFSSDMSYGDVISHVRTYLPNIDLPQLPEWPQVVDETTLDDARARFHDIDLEFHPKYIETLSNHLMGLREHFASISVPFSPSPGYTFTSMAEALETLVNEARSQFEESTPSPQAQSFVSRGADFMSEVCDGIEANVEAMREQREEMFDQMREGFDHMKEGLSNMRDNINHELDIIGNELTAIRDELGHEFDVLKDELMEITAAVQRSFHGVHLIGYSDLPQDWKNNPFVSTGYRFIPKERWGLLLRSVFECHNETLNIHTHLIPFAIWFSNLVFFNLSASYILSLWTPLSPHLYHAQQTVASHIIPHVETLPPWLDQTIAYTNSTSSSVLSTLIGFFAAASSLIHSLPTPPFPLAITPIIKARGETMVLETSALTDPIELAFMSFALLCLFCSAVWHTMTGCADKKSMEFCARCDYIGIGWLISASVATVVYYGFMDCHPTIGNIFLGLCLCTGAMGNVFPFMKWFNMHEYRLYRIAFFLSMAFVGLAPMMVLAYLHSFREMYDYVCVLFPSFLSYLIGLAFYATHAPERFLPPNVRLKLDVIGGSSHAIWHCFIVLAVSQHKAAIQLLKMGVQCRA